MLGDRHTMHTNAHVRLHRRGHRTLCSSSGVFWEKISAFNLAMLGTGGMDCVHKQIRTPMPCCAVC
jgi:hypothetical protein